ncbi:MAG TPA: T9SS type A sorting domain-containing protein, partial [Bacteroidales bacterium]|nr:T9SS type A sorting domain-containing protein [Bacteroidales bacterium]
LITVSGSNLNLTLKTVCYGDYDASSSKYKDSTTTWGSAKSFSKEIIHKSDEMVMTNDNGYFEIPLSISTKMNELSALGLELNYPASQYKLVSAVVPNAKSKNGSLKINASLQEIIASDDDLLVTDIDGVIRVVYATTNHFDVAANDQLIVLGFRAINDLPQGELDFFLSGTGVIADQYGVENEEPYLSMPKVMVQGTQNGFEFTGYPNPFNGEANITYSLPENGSVKLKVYNAIGELVSELVNETQQNGRHTVTFTPENLPAGMYTFKLEFSGLTETKCLVLKMIH